MKYTHMFISMDQKTVFKCTKKEFSQILPLLDSDSEWCQSLVNDNSNSCSIFKEEVEIVQNALKQMRISTKINNYVDKL